MSRKSHLLHGLPIVGAGNNLFVGASAKSVTVELHETSDIADRKNNWAFELEGQVIEKHLKIIKMLASGGMGSVFVAEHSQLKKQVALKILRVPPEPRQTARFLREAQLASRLNHPNIVRILSFGKNDGRPYLTMELLEGRTLREALANGPLDSELVRAIGIDLCSALVHAHDRRIVHRDIKPSNIFLVAEPDGQRAVLLDFGVAKFLDESGQRLTQTGVMIGTPGYLSPEQCGNATVDERADLYSLGCVLYECLTGAPPFERDTSLGVMMAHLHEEPNQLPLSIPTWFARLVATLLRKSPGERPASAAVVLDALENERAPDVVQATRRRSFVPRIAVSFTWTLMLALVAGVISVGLWLALNGSDSDFDKPQVRTYDSMTASALKSIQEFGAGSQESSEFSAAKDAIQQADGIASAARETGNDSELYLVRLEKLADLNCQLADLLPDSDRRKLNLYSEASSKLDRATDYSILLRKPDLERVSLRAIAVGRKAFELSDHNPLSDDRPIMLQYADTAVKRSGLLFEKGRYSECVPILEQARHIREQLAPFQFPSFCVYSCLAEVYSRIGRNKDAAKYCGLAGREIENGRIEIAPDDEGKISAVTDALLRLADAEILLKDYAAAEKFARYGVVGFEKFFIKDNATRKSYYPRMLAELAKVRMSQGRIAEAKALMDRAVKLGPVTKDDGRAPLEKRLKDESTRGSAGKILGHPTP